MKSGYWRNLTTTDFDTNAGDEVIAILPVSAIEQHGPHLPLATDALINDGIIDATLDRISDSITVLVLPNLSIGDSLEHTAFPGTLSVSTSVLAEMWLDVARSVAAAGIRKLVVFNSHGGQKALVDQLALRIRAELELLAVRANYFAFGVPDRMFDEREVAFGIHGGEIETSLMLHLHPHLVRRDALRDFGGLPEVLADKHTMLGAEKPAGFGWMSQDLNESGVCGNAAAADAERGAAYLDFLADRFDDLLLEVAETPLGIIGRS